MALFWQNCLIAVKQVVILYIIVAGGYVCDKTKVFTEKTARACNNLLFYAITPCVIVNSFLTTELSADTARGLALAAGCAALTHVTGIVLSLPFFRDTKKPNNGIFKFASVYGNMGYMALPLAQAVILLATAPKSNSVVMAIDRAMKDVKAGKAGPFPRQLQNVHADGAGFEREQGYLYPHDFPGHWVRQQYLPDNLVGTRYYEYGDNKFEQSCKSYWKQIKGD